MYVTNNSLRFYSSYHNSTLANVRHQEDRLVLRLVPQRIPSGSASGRGEDWLWEMEGLNGCPGVGSLAQNRILSWQSGGCEEREMRDHWY